jgi:hypothetical protein
MTSTMTPTKPKDVTEPTSWQADGSVATAHPMTMTPEPERAETRTEPKPEPMTYEQKRLLLDKASFERAVGEYIACGIELSIAEAEHAAVLFSCGPRLDALRRAAREPDATPQRLRSFPNFPGELASTLLELGLKQSALNLAEHRLAGLRRRLGLTEVQK